VNSGTPQMPEIKGFGDNILSKNEKLTGGIITALVIIVGLVALSAVLPGINLFLGNVITMIGKAWTIAAMLGTTALVIWVAMAKRTHTLAKILFSKISRAVTKLFIKYGPTTILDIYVDEHLVKKAQDTSRAINTVKAQLEIVSNTIDENAETMQENTQFADTLRRRYYDERGTKKWKQFTLDGLPPDAQGKDRLSLMLQKAGNPELVFRQLSAHNLALERSNKNLQKQQLRLTTYVTILDKFKQAFDYRITVVKNFCDVLTREYNAMMASAAAAQSMAALFGTDDMKQVFEMTVNYMQNRIANFTTTVDSFITENMPVVMKMELEGDVSEDQLMQRLNEMDKKADDLISEVDIDSKAIDDPTQLAALVKSQMASTPVSTQSQAAPKKRRLLN
jgi:hypothetical protein